MAKTKAKKTGGSKGKGPADRSGYPHYAQRVPKNVSDMFDRETDADAEFNRNWSRGKQLAGAMFLWVHVLPDALREDAMLWAMNPSRYDPAFGRQVREAFERTYRVRQELEPPPEE